MDIKLHPDPEEPKKLIITVDDQAEKNRLNEARLSTRHTQIGKFLMMNRVVNETYRGPSGFPRSFEVTRKQLGMAAGELLAHHPDAEDVVMARQIVDFFEEQLETSDNP